MNIHKSKTSKGFTLIEIMIVVAIVGILTAIALPSYQEQIRKARRADAMDALTDCAAVQARNFSTGAPPSYLQQSDITTAGTPTTGLCNSLVSKEGHYTLAITNAGCLDNGSYWCFLITATPVATSSQANDNLCASFTISHAGRKTALDSTTADSTATCWRS